MEIQLKIEKKKKILSFKECTVPKKLGVKKKMKPSKINLQEILYITKFASFTDNFQFKSHYSETLNFKFIILKGSLHL